MTSILKSSSLGGRPVTEVVRRQLVSPSSNRSAVKRKFQKLDIECWESGVKLGIVKPAICLLHTALDHGRVILEAIEELDTESPGSKRTLTFKPSRRKREIYKLRLQLASPRPELRVMSISCGKDAAAIEMTGTGLHLLRDAIRIWCDGGEDFCVSPRHAHLKKHELGLLDRASGELWFWGPTMEP